MKRTPRVRRSARARDQQLTAFAPMLAELISRVPGALAAAFVDVEGETVEYWGSLDSFDIKVAAAHLQIELAQLARSTLFGEPRTLMIRGERRSFIARVLPDAYALVVLLGRRARFTPSRRAFDVCEAAIRREAGWSRLPGPWYVVEVSYDRQGRPTRLHLPSPGSYRPPPRPTSTGPATPESAPSAPAKLTRGIAAEVLGTLAGLQPQERGYRVRLASGKELTLVRESGGFWYSDEPVS